MFLTHEAVDAESEDGGGVEPGVRPLAFSVFFFRALLSSSFFEVTPGNVMASLLRFLRRLHCISFCIHDGGRSHPCSVKIAAKIPPTADMRSNGANTFPYTYVPEADDTNAVSIAFAAFFER